MPVTEADWADVSVRTRLRGATCPVHPDHPLALVGEAPGPRTRADLPFYPYPPGSAAGRLLAILGWERGRYLRTFARMNLLADYPGPSFPVARARACVPKICEALAPRPLLLMGRGVMAAFGAQEPPLSWFTYIDATGRESRCAMVPHPSGRNLWYNEPANREAVRAFVEGLAMQAGAR